MENKIIELNTHEYAHLEDSACLRDEYAPAVHNKRDILLITFGKYLAQAPDYNEAKALLRDVVQSMQNAKSGTIGFKINRELYEYVDLISAYLELYQPYVEDVVVPFTSDGETMYIYVTFDMNNKKHSVFDAYSY